MYSVKLYWVVGEVEIFRMLFSFPTGFYNSFILIASIRTYCTQILSNQLYFVLNFYFYLFVHRWKKNTQCTQIQLSTQTRAECFSFGYNSIFLANQIDHMMQLFLFHLLPKILRHNYTANKHAQRKGGGCWDGQKWVIHGS